MDRQFLRCVKCGGGFSDLSLSKCSDCGGILIVDYPDESLAAGSGCLELDGDGKKLDGKVKVGKARDGEVKAGKARDGEAGIGYGERRAECGIYSFGPLLPKLGPQNRVSLEEGHTPYIRGTNLEKETGQAVIWLKDESRNPTGSFKDRALSLCVSMAKELGYKKVVVASSGNGAASASAYGAKAGLETRVVVPQETPQGKIINAMVCGAKIHRIPGKFDKSFEYAEKLAEKGKVMNLTTTFLSPVGVEGYKTIAYELYLQSETLPEYIFVPVGAGPLLYGIYKGFAELIRMGRTAFLPKLVAVQSSGCAPVVRAWETGKTVSTWEDPHGVASAISDPLKGYEDNGDLTVEAINKSRGFAVAVGDQDILDAGKLLARTEGIFVEPSSAAVLAGLLRAREDGIVGGDAKTALILTGSGLKDPLKYMETSKI